MPQNSCICIHCIQIFVFVFTCGMKYCKWCNSRCEASTGQRDFLYVPSDGDTLGLSHLHTIPKVVFVSIIQNVFVFHLYHICMVLLYSCCELGHGGLTWTYTRTHLFYVFVLYFIVFVLIFCCICIADLLHPLGRDITIFVRRPNSNLCPASL